MVLFCCSQLLDSSASMANIVIPSLEHAGPGVHGDEVLVDLRPAGSVSWAGEAGVMGGVGVVLGVLSSANGLEGSYVVCGVDLKNEGTYFL